MGPTPVPVPLCRVPGAGGADVFAALDDDLLLLRVSARWYHQVRPRSGLALKHGVTLLNSPGTIDGDIQDTRHMGEPRR